MLAVGLRVRAKVVGRFDEVRRGLQENQRRHRGCELGLAFAGSLTVSVSVRPRPLVDGVHEALRISCLGSVVAMSRCMGQCGNQNIMRVSLG